MLILNILFLLVILLGLPIIGFIAWRNKARKTACVIWMLEALLLAPLFKPVPVRRSTGGRSCIANLKQIDGAVQQWALEHQKKTNDTYTLSDPVLLAYLKGSALPVCPKGGLYSAGTNVNDSPKCSLVAPGHTL